MSNYSNKMLKEFEEYFLKVVDNNALKNINPKSAEPLNYFLQIGGKRIRPLSCLISYSLFKPDIQKVFPVAAAFELFHNFTLIHDDIMDNSLIRRGKQTIHVRNGQSAAILSGDVMMIVAYQELEKMEGNAFQKMFTLFNKTATEVCCGQQFDIDFEKEEFISLGEYIKMIRLKTSVLLAACFSSGALLAGADDVVSDLYDFGLNLGLAFQIKDDYLDTFGDKLKIGKRVGGDIVMNKKTLLTAYLMQKLKDENHFHKYVKVIAIKDEKDKIASMQNLLSEYGIKEDYKQMLHSYLSKAEAIKNKLPLDKTKKESLQYFLEKLKSRQS